MQSDGIILRVAEANATDPGMARVRLDEESRLALDVDIGDVVSIEKVRPTVGRVFRARPEDENKGIVRIDSVMRNNCGASIGDKVKVKKVFVEEAKKIVLAPIIRKDQRLRFGEGIDDFVQKALMRRPMIEQDSISVPGLTLAGHTGLLFKVVKTIPSKVPVEVSESTQIEIREDPASEVLEEVTRVSYEDIGGLSDQLGRIREIIELPLKHPELFERLGITPPKGVLLSGPPGTGKTLIAKAVANESGANFYAINGPEIMSKYYGQSEQKLREIFQKAEESEPSIIFIDEIDSIAPKREDVQGEVERRVVAQLLTLMDGLKERGHVIVIGATNRIDAVDPALRRPGRFDREITIGVPDKKGRKEILAIHTRGMPLGMTDDEKENFLEKIADLTYGFVGADLAALTRESAMNALRRYLPEIDLDKPIPTEVLEKMVVTEQDFMEALKTIEPSSLREVTVEVPNVKWDDIGGLENVKSELREAVELPLLNPDVFKRLGIRAPKGFLLYGPPGTGKTLLAKAVANESNANFISIKGPEVLSKWVGESEKAVREIFKKAKQVAPSIVFLDEIDSIAPRRGASMDSGVTERIVNQLLTSLDGIEVLNGVVVIAATNRPDIIDPALLRAGRFDKIMYIPPPDEEGRYKILQVHTKNMPLAPDVDLRELAKKTDGFVGADIENLCREAGMMAYRSNPDATEVTQNDFLNALKTIRPSVDESVIKFYNDLAKSMGRDIIERKKSVEDLGLYQ
ncbi:VCP-like ATPase [Picrophilus oshimae]|uniref:Cell division cycle protein 48 n=1 Tax=Picrophilus torridus (strain ATCC 700027 / DSM 9790 / JCM 10055 / NBRC 100828 / KAW 2/3) TaxID=1122961 RepID=Q6L1W1_PICTO|nr:VCP-like ATPase [Picrophilus oshimae]AAT43041.1 cell division cycle protein 48 [Picrophilus oshimae DSM 9789]SMD30657.1 transitional endoplasmic reticulum ATPase [Picrophilus oshimae DSM 9789]